MGSNKYTPGALTKNLKPKEATHPEIQMAKIFDKVLCVHLTLTQIIKERTYNMTDPK